MRLDNLIEELREIQLVIDNAHKQMSDLNRMAVNLQNTLADAERVKARIVVDLTTAKLEVI